MSEDFSYTLVLPMHKCRRGGGGGGGWNMFVVVAAYVSGFIFLRGLRSLNVVMSFLFSIQDLKICIPLQ